MNNHNLSISSVEFEKVKKYITHVLLSTMKHNYAHDSEIINKIDAHSIEVLGGKVQDMEKPSPIVSILPEGKNITQVYLEEATKICNAVGLNIKINPHYSVDGYSEKDFIIVNSGLDKFRTHHDPRHNFHYAKGGLYLFDATNDNEKQMDQKLLITFVASIFSYIPKNFITDISISNTNDLQFPNNYIKQKIPDAPIKTIVDISEPDDIYSKKNVSANMNKAQQEFMEATFPTNKSKLH